MPRTLSPDVLEQKDKEFNRPVELYQIFLDEETLYFAMFPEDIEFFDEDGNQQTYYAAAISRDPVSRNNETNPDSTTITFDNVARNFSAYIANTEFVGREVSVWKVFLDADRNVISLAIPGIESSNQEILQEGAGLDYRENFIPIFSHGIIDSVSINEQNLTAQVVSNLDILRINRPKGKYQVNCRFEFGGPGCKKDVPVKTGTVDSIDGTIINDSAITEDADYWKHGIIEIGKEKRKIVSSGNGYVEVEYSFLNSAAGDSYEIEADCDYSYDGGHGCTFWNNTSNYGGFLEIPKIRNIREVE